MGYSIVNIDEIEPEVRAPPAAEGTSRAGSSE